MTTPRCGKPAESPGKENLSPGKVTQQSVKLIAYNVELAQNCVMANKNTEYRILDSYDEIKNNK